MKYGYFKGKQQQEYIEQLVDKSLIEEISEDEAIGEEIDSFPPLTQQMMDEVGYFICTCYS